MKDFNSSVRQKQVIILILRFLYSWRIAFRHKLTVGFITNDEHTPGKHLRCEVVSKIYKTTE